MRDDQPQPLREEAFGPGWKERFVDYERACCTISVGQAVSRSLSYIVIEDFASLQERNVLLESALELQQVFLAEGNGACVFKGIRPKWVTECCRFSVQELLNNEARAVSASMLQRLLALLEHGRDEDSSDARLADLALRIFGIKVNLHERRAKWYDEMTYDKISNPEPMVNIYETGGFFKRHADGMNLTLLVVLNDVLQGGGTAFYADDAENAAPVRSEQPAAGSAMIWAGALMHSALPVTEGMRAVFVGSFDLVSSQAQEE